MFSQFQSAFTFSSETCLLHPALTSSSAYTTPPQQQAADLLHVLSCFMLLSYKQICFLSRVLPHCVEAMKENEALKKPQPNPSFFMLYPFSMLKVRCNFIYLAVFLLKADIVSLFLLSFLFRWRKRKSTLLALFNPLSKRVLL